MILKFKKDFWWSNRTPNIEKSEIQESGTKLDFYQFAI